MDGILPLWKPKGFTSHDCVMKIRKLFKTKKVGHTGTLDPEVEGVLPICIGQATKVVPFLTDTSKTYIAEVTLGRSTETEDSHGETIDTKNVDEQISMDKVLAALEKFHGTITQIPPMYSAVKVNGKKLYEYAREGKTVDRPERKVTIYNLSLLSENIVREDSLTKFSFEVECSKGTYIRTLCVDIGKELGYPAHMSELTRTSTGSFDRNSCFTFEQIAEAVDQGKEQGLLAPLIKGLEHLDVYSIDPDLVYNITNGQKLAVPKQIPVTDPFRVQLGERLLAIYQIHPINNNLIKPVRVFDTNSK